MPPAAPEPIIDLPLRIRRATGHNPDPGNELYLVCEADLPHWGVLKSYHATAFYDGAIASSLRTYDMGVKNRDGKISVMFQMLDCKFGNDPKRYSMTASFDFLADGIVWPDVTKTVKK